MIAPLGRKRALIVLAVMAWSCATGVASAQAPDQQSMKTPSLAVVKARVPPGDIVHVTDTKGATIKGKLAAATDHTVQVKVSAGLRSVASAEVHRIQWQQPDSPLTGVLIGAAVGAIPGVYWLIADPNECKGMCPEEYGLIAIGALVGGIIDHAITRKVTVYTAATSNDRGKSVMIGPFVMRERKGVQISVTF